MQFGDTPQAVTASGFELDVVVKAIAVVEQSSTASVPSACIFPFYLREARIEAYQCNADNDQLDAVGLAATRNRGSLIRVCVKPDAEAVTAGMKMHNIDWFTFYRGTVSQEAIIGYNLEADNGLTKLTCSNGADVCVIEIIPFAAYFSTDGVVLGSGGGAMQCGDTPQAAAASKFELDVVVIEGDPDSLRSGALRSGVVAVTTLVMVGTFAMIF
jgi:hypothetical protein